MVYLVFRNCRKRGDSEFAIGITFLKGGGMWQSSCAG